MTSPPVLGTETLPTYLDLTEQVKPWLQINPAVTSGDGRLELILDMACHWVQRWIGQAVGPTTYGPADGLGKFDGSGGLNSGYIVLPKYPVISVTQVIEYQGTNPVQLFEVDPSTGNTGGDGFQINYRTGRMTRVLGGIWNRPFMPGSNNVWVTWVAGYNPIPADIVMATLELVAHWWRNTQQQSGNRPGALGSDYDPMTEAGLWQGVPNRITGLLSPYIRVGIR